MSPQDFSAIAKAVQETPDVATLRGRFPGAHFTACSDDDVPARVNPAALVGNYRLYLITGASGHCIEFTGDVANATGVVVAQTDADD